jgi:hypothetical protein
LSSSIRITDNANNTYPPINTFSFPILSAIIPEGIPTAVWLTLITAYTMGIMLSLIPSSDDFKRMNE